MKRRNRGAPTQSVTHAHRNTGGYTCQPIRNTQSRVGRNKPCPCGSDVKYKKCCGKPVELPSRTEIAYQTFQSQYTPEQAQAEQQFVRHWGFTPNLAQLQMFIESDTDGLATMIAAGLSELENNEKYVYAVCKLRRLITPKNHLLVTAAVKDEWEATLAEYDAAKIVDESGE